MNLADPPLVTFDAERHEYRCAGRIVPHVTAILEPLYNWSKVATDVLDRACDLGRAVHMATEFDDRGTLVESSVSGEVGCYLDAWRKFRRETGFTPRLIEQRVHHAVLGFAGTLDREDDEAIIDIKSGAEHDSHGVQIAGYAMARAFETKGPYKKRRAVYLSRDGRYHNRTFTDPSDYPTFAGLVAVCHWRRNHG